MRVRPDPAWTPGGLPRSAAQIGVAFPGRAIVWLKTALVRDGQVLTSPEIRNRMITQGADPAFLGSEDFSKFLAAEMPRWAEAVRKSGAKLD